MGDSDTPVDAAKGELAEGPADDRAWADAQGRELSSRDLLQARQSAARAG